MLKDSAKIFRKCEHPNCECEGEYRAPKNRELKEYYWFCLKHVSEYNKSWNFYDGMSQEEIELENKLDETWHSPSWKFGVSLDNLAKQGKLNDPFEIYNTYMKRKPNIKNSQSKISLQSALTVRELEAVQVFEICFPYTENQLKKRYKILVKKYHPDLNQGSKKAEEMFKKISECYRILLKKISKNK